MPLLRRPLLLASLAAAVGCYAAEPVAVGVAPEMGTRMSFQLNDQGRAALGLVMGDGLERTGLIRIKWGFTSGESLILISITAQFQSLPA